MNNLGDNITISSTADGKVEVISHNDLSGRYLKYLYVKILFLCTPFSEALELTVLLL